MARDASSICCKRRNRNEKASYPVHGPADGLVSDRRSPRGCDCLAGRDRPAVYNVLSALYSGGSGSADYYLYADKILEKEEMRDRKMKRFLTVTLTLTTLFALTAPAFADVMWEPDNNSFYNRHWNQCEYENRPFLR